jgi:hypothetical protein
MHRLLRLDVQSRYEASASNKEGRAIAKTKGRKTWKWIPGKSKLDSFEAPLFLGSSFSDPGGSFFFFFFFC